MPYRKTDLSDELAEQWRIVHGRTREQPRREYVFHPLRQWRADFAFMNSGLIVECEGGIWNGRKRGEKAGGRNQAGAHTGGAGYVKDIEKYNAMVLLGWRLIRVTGEMITNGSALTLIERAIDSSWIMTQRSVNGATHAGSEARGQ